jgi:hypothetical protein
VTNGWGEADIGGAWTTHTTSSRFSVGSGVGSIVATPGSTSEVSLPGVLSSSTELRSRFTVNSLATGGSLYMSFEGRRVDNSNDYRAKAILETNGRIQLQLVRRAGAETVLANVFLPATFTHSVGNSYEIAVQAVGTSPKTLRAKIWRTGTSEPNWQLTATDSTAALQRTGSPAVLYYASRSFTGASATLTVDAFRVTTP